MFEVSVSGSAMLLGEHAVLHGHSAVVCAIDRRINVRLIPQSNSKEISIYSDILGRYKTTINKLVVAKPFQFVLCALLQVRDRFPFGFDLYIESQFSDKVGFGSSAAVTVATLGAVSLWLDGSIDPFEIYNQGVKVVREVQGVGSGADVAASVFGGTIAYRTDPLKIDKLACSPPTSLVYVGYKMPTRQAIDLVRAKRAANSVIVDQIFLQIGECCSHGIVAIKKHDWKVLGEIFKRHYQLQKKLGVSDENLNEIVDECNQQQGILGTKISGSGLGDCVVTIGRLPKNYFPSTEKQRRGGVKQFDVSVTDMGCCIESFNGESIRRCRKTYTVLDGF